MADYQNPQPVDNRQDDLENQAQPTLAFHDMMERQRQLIQLQADLDCENRILRGERPPSEEVVDMLSDPEALFRCLEASIKKMTAENERLKSEQAPKEIVEPNANASTADTQRRKTQYACEGCGTAVWLSSQEAGRTHCIKCNSITVRNIRKGAGRTEGSTVKLAEITFYDYADFSPPGIASPSKNFPHEALSRLPMHRHPSSLSPFPLSCNFAKGFPLPPQQTTISLPPRPSSQASRIPSNANLHTTAMATTPVIHPLRLNWHHELTRRFYTSDIPNTLTPKAMHYQRLFEECFFLRHENDVFRGTRRPNPLDLLSGRDIGVIIHFIDARIGALEVEVEVLRRENRWLRGLRG